LQGDAQRKMEALGCLSNLPTGTPDARSRSAGTGNRHLHCQRSEKDLGRYSGGLLGQAQQNFIWTSL